MNTKRKISASEKDGASKRHLERAEPYSGLRVFNVVFPLDSGNIQARVLDYHLMGASLEMDRVAFEKFRKLKEIGELHFYIGQKCMRFGVGYRVCWFDEISCQVGIEFKDEIKDWVERDLRIPTHSKIKPSISGIDPTDPNRKILFSVENVSMMGMMLSTSLSNKHLFPGMELRKATLVVPGKKAILIDLSVQNVHLSQDKSQLMIGTLVRSKTKKEYSQVLQDYLAALGDLTGIDHSNYRKSDFFTKKLKSALTFKTVTSEEEYQKVLDLRFSGYGHKGKVRQGQRIEDMGEGLQNEGLIIGAYLGKLLVASVELRFGSRDTKFRFASIEELKKLGVEDTSKLMEINKLVVHPNYQGSDILLGIFHKLHAIVISEGYLSGMLATTDTLYPLYIKLGSKKTGIRKPHPTIKDEYLNVVIIDKEVYLGESDFNPFLWKVVYGNFHKFLIQNQLAKKSSFRPMAYIVGLSKIALSKLRIKRYLKQLGPKNSQENSLSYVDNSLGASSSALTEQHLNASVIYPYICEGEKLIGEERVTGILKKIGLPRSYFAQKSNWVSVEALDIFLDEYSKFGNISELSKNAGRVSMSKQYLGLNYYFLKNLGEPRRVLSVIGKFTPRLNKTRTFKVINADKNGALVELGLKKGYPLPKHRESCLNWQENLSYAVALLVKKPGKIEKLSCVYDGSDSTIYKISWDLRNKAFFNFSGAALWALSLYGWIALGLSLIDNKSVNGGYFLLSLVGFVSLFLKYNGIRKEKKEQDEYFEKLQEEADIKYADLQEAKVLIDHRYQEAMLLDKISSLIQKSSDLGGILHTGLSQACELLEYSRAFVMILNKETKCLETAAVHGAEKADMSLSRFSVDVSVRRDNPALLSSVYHSGHSVMINDVEQHMFQLNEASKALIKNMGVKRFVMVAVPSDGENWGVIVAEKSSHKSELSKKDIVLLERVAQMMGVAIDKQEAFDAEARLRKSFQRYVPATVFEELSNSQVVNLGGVEKRIGCLFLDIRSFTHIASTFGPLMSVDLLNRFFTFVQPIFAKHGGAVDKFLGDGVLLTWGAVDSVSDIENKSVESALEILSSLNTFNDESVKFGHPRIQIGMGIHVGPAIVGNVGSIDRMEFTAIGHTVNFASRLESLNKIHHSSLCLSDEIFLGLKPEIQSRFSRISGVAVRGVTGDTSIAVLDLKEVQGNRGAA
jgi:class 3 adenylate cyclase